MTSFFAVDGSTIWDVCLNTYGTLNLIGKLMVDNNYPGVETYPTAGQEFIFDETLVSNQQTFKRTALSGEKYATKRLILPAPVTPGLFITTDADGTEHTTWVFTGSSDFAMLIEWGDGTTDEYAASGSHTVSHTYAVAGPHEAKVWFSDFALITQMQLNDGAFNARVIAVSNLHFLTSLEILDLSRNMLPSFDPLGALPATLTEINLKRNELTVFDPALALPAGVEIIDLSYNNLTGFDPALALPAALTFLDISFNGLLDFLINIDLPAALETLILENNSFATFAPNTALPDTIQTLRLTNSGIEIFSLAGPFPLSLNNFVITGNGLITHTINVILTDLDAIGYSAGTFAMQGQAPAAPPSGGGITAKNNLIGRGCTVTTD